MAREDYGGIYAIVNFSERKFYVGSSIEIVKRTLTHVERLSRGKHHSKKLQADWDRLGSGAFEIITIERGLDLLELQDRELFWMEALGSLGVYNSFKPGRRADNRIYHLESLNMGRWTMRVGEVVLDRGIPLVVDRISKRGCSTSVVIGGQYLFERQFYRLKPVKKKIAAGVNLE